DYENDKASGKKTMVVLLGLRKSKIYHTSLIIISFIALLLFIVLKQWWWSCIYFLPYALLFRHLSVVWKIRNPKEFDPEMKKVALSTFAIALLFLISTFL